MKHVRNSVLFLIAALFTATLTITAHAQPADQLSWIVSSTTDLPARTAPPGVAVRSLRGAALYLVTFRDTVSRDAIRNAWKDRAVIDSAIQHDARCTARQSLADDPS